MTSVEVCLILSQDLQTIHQKLAKIKKESMITAMENLSQWQGSNLQRNLGFTAQLLKRLLLRFTESNPFLDVDYSEAILNI